jgi:hypothetical protein
MIIPAHEDNDGSGQNCTALDYVAQGTVVTHTVLPLSHSRELLYHGFLGVGKMAFEAKLIHEAQPRSDGVRRYRFFILIIRALFAPFVRIIQSDTQ